MSVFLGCVRFATTGEKFMLCCFLYPFAMRFFAGLVNDSFEMGDAMV